MRNGSQPTTARRMRRRLFTGAHGQAIVADVVGRGAPVVLAHGGGQTRTAWARTATALMQAGHQAIAIDMRGHGESEWSPSGAYLPHRERRDRSATLSRYLRRGDDGRFRWHWDPRFVTSVTQGDAGQTTERLMAASTHLRLPVH